MMIIENPETNKYIRYLLNRLRTYDTVVNRNTDAINRIYELHQDIDGSCDICKTVSYPCDTIKVLDKRHDKN